MAKKKVKMRVLDWWTEENEKNFYANPLIQMLQQKYEIVYSDEPDFILFGPFGYKHLEYDCVRIFYTGENMRPNYNIADYSMDYDYATYEDRHLHAPLMFWNFYNKDTYWRHDRRNFLQEKTKFCSFVVSNNASTDMRDNFFDFLNTYKRVDSGGRWKNNIGGNVANKIEWLQSYKFNICFENGSYPGYLTEKLFDAFAAGCVPIYWGDTSLRCKKTDSQTYTNNTEYETTTHAVATMGGGGVI